MCKLFASNPKTTSIHLDLAPLRLHRAIRIIFRRRDVGAGAILRATEGILWISIWFSISISILVTIYIYGSGSGSVFIYSTVDVYIHIVYIHIVYIHIVYIHIHIHIYIYISMYIHIYCVYIYNTYIYTSLLNDEFLHPNDSKSGMTIRKWLVSFLAFQSSTILHRNGGLMVV